MTLKHLFLFNNRTTVFLTKLFIHLISFHHFDSVLQLGVKTNYFLWQMQREEVFAA
jgi:hypothetical protein